jgi:hypothetical protein
MPAKTYKEYCREAVERDPKTWGSMFNADGSKRELPSIYKRCKVKILYDVPEEELRKMEKVDPILLEPKPDLEIRGTEIKLKGRKLNLTILPMPENPTRKEYNRIWMSNCRVRERIKKITKLYGVTEQI